METSVPWDRLLEEALRVQQMAYAPYSNYHVGAAGITESGNIYIGCNVENSSYGVTLCGEAGLVTALRAGGESKLVGFLCVGNGEVTLPCGRCRQLLAEHGGSELLVACPDGSKRRLEELLPGLVDGPDSPAYK